MRLNYKFECVLKLQNSIQSKAIKMNLSKYVLIVAGGSGTRMKSSMPKQLLKLESRPILMHTIQVFYETDNFFQFLVVLPAEFHDKWRELLAEFRFEIPHKLVAAGKTRFESVKNGLSEIKTGGLVAIHDGVRPLVDEVTVRHCFELAGEKGSAVPCMPLAESLRRVYNEDSQSVDRNHYVSIQTPQVFDVDEIKKAYALAMHEDFTDDATVYEALGKTIHLTRGNRENIKITWPSDIYFAEAILRAKDKLE